MRLPPLSVIESWPPRNPTNPITTGNTPIIFNLTLFPLVCFFISLRIYTRVRISKSFGSDDWLILASLIPTCAFAAITLISQFHYQWNRHIWDVDPSTFEPGLKIILSSIIVFDAATNLTKLSILALTYRIVGAGSKKLRKVVAGVIVIVSLQSTIFVFAEVFQCRPPSQYWTLSLTPQSCVSEPALLLAAGIINTITDFIVVLLPAPIVFKLQLRDREHFVLVLLFGTGFIVSIVGGIRTYYTYLVTVSHDRSWDIFPVYITASVELYIGIICACVPATKKFFSHYTPRLMGTNHLSHAQISLDTKQTHSRNPSGITDIERAIMANRTAPLPYDGKGSTQEVEDILALQQSFAGFEFDLSAETLPHASHGSDVEETHAISPVESLTESHHQLVLSTSRGQHG